MFKSTSTSLILPGVLAISLIYGVSQIMTGVELRRTGQTLGQVLDHAA